MEGDGLTGVVSKDDTQDATILKPLRSCFARIKNIDGKTLGKDGKPLKAFRNVHFEPDVYTRYIPLNDAPVCNTTNITSDIEAHQDESVEPKSFASVINNTPTKKVVKLTPLTNNEEVQGAHVTLPLNAAKEVNSRFINTLYGVMLQNGFFFFQFSSRDGTEKVLENGPWLIRLVPIILNVWTPTSKLKREEITMVPVWVKLHNVPIVAYSEIGLSLLTTTLGKPIMFDGYTSNMCVNSWGINSYARALIEVSAEKELMESIVMAIPIDNGLEHSLETIEVEYEWQPPRCATCKIFDHQDDKCPKKPKVVITTQQSKDGFVEVTKKKMSGKQNSKPRQIEGIRLTKPKPNYQFRPINNQASKSDGASTSQPDDAAKEDHIPKNKTDSDLIPKHDVFEVDSNHMPFNNSFASLMDMDTTTGTQNKPNANHSIDSDQSGYDSDSEEVENIILEQPRFMGNRTKSDEAKGASTPSNEVLNVYCGYLEHKGNWDWTSNGNWCSKGSRIILGWNPNDVDISVITQNDQVMHTRIWFKADKKELFCSFVYAHNRYIHHRALWSNLCLHKHYVRDRSWCLLGDFNAALNLADHSSGSSNIDISMREFRDCVEEIEPYRISDHSPAVLKIPMSTTVKPRPFKFPNILIHNVRFKDLVKEGWNVQISGFYMFRVVKKLKRMKSGFQKLLYNKGNLQENVKRLRFELDKVQSDLDLDPFNVILREEEAAYVLAFNEALVMEERFLKQKAKIKWLRVGDSNSDYFHKAVKGRISRSRIDAISTTDGTLFEADQVPVAFVNHYTAFLGQHREVKDVIFSMGNDKSPGPDGYTAAFYKEAWDIVASDVTRDVQKKFTNSNLLKELNHNIIALIPKVASPSRINDYRPISCCKVLFKCISKIIANRIKGSLAFLISPNQSAFVLGRRISDNILLTQELMHNYHLDRSPPRCAFKVDIQNAYDTVDWGFLKATLVGFGFHPRLIHWIMECVSTTSFLLSINGAIHGYFKGKRSLRQGDPISPYLFKLIMEVLTLILRRRGRESDSFCFHRYCDKLDIINLCFTDVLFLFAHGDANSAHVIIRALEE
ncbi:hypothetical protein Tco_1033939, partial [Tanacetum coccineum]